MKKIILLIILLIFSCKKEPYKPSYKVKQKVYSVQGIDSVITDLYWYKNSIYVGHGIYSKRNTLDKKLSDSLEAVKFIRTHKEYN